MRYLIVSEKLDHSLSLWKKFVNKMLETKEIKSVKRIDSVVTTLQDDEFKFISKRRKEDMMRGFRGEVISGRLFSTMIDMYDPSIEDYSKDKPLIEIPKNAEYINGIWTYRT